MPQPELKFRFGEEGLEQLAERLDAFKKRGETAFRQIPKDLQRDLTKVGETLEQGVKKTIAGTVTSASLAVARAGFTTFDEALSKANNFRDASARLAVTAGRGFEDVGTRVQKVSRSIGEMPDKVTGWGRAVARVGGNFATAVDAMGAFKDRALQLDRPLEDLQSSAAALRKGFGLEAAADVNRFFGVMDTQASRVGVTVQRLGNQWSAFEDRFSRMGTKPGDASVFSGITAAFAASSKNPDAAVEGQQFGMDTLDTGIRLVEHRMRARGRKGFSVTNDKGEVDSEKWREALQFMQKDMLRFYGGNKKRAIEVEAGENLEGRRAVGTFLNADLSSADALAKLPPEERRAMERYMGLTNERTKREAGKEVADANLGKTLLPGQDTAISAGGGATGVLMSQASTAFSSAVDKFGGIVSKIYTGGYTGGAGGAAAGAAAGTAAAGAVGKAGAVMQGAVKLAGAGALGYEVGTLLDEGLGLSDLIADKLAKALGTDYRADPKPPDHGKLASEIANRTLKVQIVQDAPPPLQSSPGQGQ